MAGITQAAGVAVALGGSSVTSTTTATANGGFSLQMASSARPRVVPRQQGLISLSSLFGSSLECCPSRRFTAHVGLQPIAHASVNEAAVENHVSTNSNLGSLPDLGGDESKEELPAKPSSEPTISALMAEVINLVKLVDSRDIVELELKHKDYEIVIRKEAQEAPAPSMTVHGPHVMGHTPFAAYPPPPPPPTPAAEAAPAPAPAAVPAPTPAAPSHPPMLSPMAGTFYRSPGPGEPAFIQVGDRVTKGQVVCIVEAMKLMNEIEADQSGTILEILAEDGKPISMETPLFSIQP